MRKNNFKDYYNKKLGDIGEKVAINYIKKLDYNVLTKNFRTSRGEIDIIAEDKSEIVFIEVKTRKNRKYGNPVDAVDKNKIDHIVNTAKLYVHLNNLYSKFIRFDIIEIYVKSEKIFINHIKNALLQ